MIGTQLTVKATLEMTRKIVSLYEIDLIRLANECNNLRLEAVSSSQRSK
jgi:hypothetical protein